MGDYLSDAFLIHSRTPQGLPLSPILSALYTASLLELADNWVHCNLTLYVDDGVIYATSTTLSVATNAAIEGYMEVLMWLRANGLDADPSKTKLMTFARQRANPNQVSHHPTKACYIDPILGPQTIKTTTHLCYLRVYIDQSLNWS